MPGAAIASQVLKIHQGARVCPHVRPLKHFHLVLKVRPDWPWLCPQKGQLLGTEKLQLSGPAFPRARMLGLPVFLFQEVPLP